MVAKSIDKINSKLYAVEFDKHSKVEIGDAQDLGIRLKPHVTLKKWGDECFIRIKPRVAYDSKDPVEVGTGKIDRIEIDDNTGDEGLHIYPLDVGDGQELGGLELEAILYKKPSSGPFNYTWDFEDSGNLEYKYQDYKNLDLAKYSPEDLAKGVVLQTDRGGWDKDGKQIVSVPEWCVRSWSVRKKNAVTVHKTKALAEKYKDGKVGHFKRVTFTDKNGLWEYGMLDIDEQSGTIMGMASQAFTDAAVLPVKFGPTFGYTTLGGSNFTMTNDILGRAKVTPGEPGTIDIIHIGLNSAWDSGEEVKAALYTDVTTPALQSPQSDTDDTGQDVPAFVNLPVTGTLNVIDQNYIIVGWTGSSLAMRRDSGGSSGDSRYDLGVTYGSWPATLNTLNSSNYYSTYATYSTVGWDTCDIDEQDPSNIDEIDGQSLANIETVDEL